MSGEVCLWLVQLARQDGTVTNQSVERSEQVAHAIAKGWTDNIPGACVRVARYREEAVTWEGWNRRQPGLESVRPS